MEAQLQSVALASRLCPYQPQRDSVRFLLPVPHSKTASYRSAADVQARGIIHSSTGTTLPLVGGSGAKARGGPFEVPLTGPESPTLPRESASGMHDFNRR